MEFYGEGPSKTFPQGFGTKIGEMFEFMGAYGCDGGDPACKRKEEVRPMTHHLARACILDTDSRF